MRLRNHQQRRIIVLVVIFMFMSTLQIAAPVAAADLTSSYDALKSTAEGQACIDKLKSGGASDAQIETFMQELDTEVKKPEYGTLTESSFNGVMYQALQEVIDNRENRSVFRAVTTQYSEEIAYTLKNKELAQNLVPLRDAVAKAVLGSETSTNQNQGTSSGNTSNTGTSTGTSTTTTPNTTNIINTTNTDQIVKQQLAQKVSAVSFDLSNSSPIVIFSGTTLNSIATEKKDILIKASGALLQISPEALALATNNELSLGVAITPAATSTTSSGSTAAGTFCSNIYEFAGSTKTSLDTVRFNQPITIEIPYTTNQTASNESLDACYFNEEVGVWIPLNGVVDTTKKVVRFTTSHLSKYAIMTVNKPGSFTDVKNHWALQNINRLVAMKVVNGYPNGSFGPENGITRAEFASILVKAFKLSNQGSKVFSDTKNHWARESIAIAYNNGIISGYNTNTFGPDDLITREQMASMVTKAAKLKTVPGNLGFSDSVKISPWARASVLSAVTGGLIYGYLDGSFKPQGQATRAEAVTLIAKTLLR